MEVRRVMEVKLVIWVKWVIWVIWVKGRTIVIWSLSGSKVIEKRHPVSDIQHLVSNIQYYTPVCRILNILYQPRYTNAAEIC
jgi:hypothetical protein